jgi:hypothetical protein
MMLVNLSRSLSKVLFLLYKLVGKQTSPTFFSIYWLFLEKKVLITFDLIAIMSYIYTLRGISSIYPYI